MNTALTACNTFGKILLPFSNRIFNVFIFTSCFTITLLNGMCLVQNKYAFNEFLLADNQPFVEDIAQISKFELLKSNPDRPSGRAGYP